MKTEQRFSEKVAPANRAGCQLWTAGTARGGYGKFWDGSRTVRAHRYAWELANGLIPDRLQILHRCDVPACVNPSHLFLGTHDSNMADMVAKGREASGSKVGNAKLDEAQAAEIFLARGTQKAIGAGYGIDQSLVSLIKNRKNWTHATNGFNQPTQPRKQA